MARIASTALATMKFLPETRFMMGASPGPGRGGLHFGFNADGFSTAGLVAFTWPGSTSSVKMKIKTSWIMNTLAKKAFILAMKHLRLSVKELRDTLNVVLISLFIYSVRLLDGP